jgi:predicted metalloprotease with PDZ domain
LFRWMNEHYAKPGKLFPDSEAVRQAAETLTHADFGDFFRKYVSGVDEIPWDTFFNGVGLRVIPSEATSAEPGFQAAQNFDQPLTVVQVDAGSDAERAGLKPGDVIVQIDGQRAGRDSLRTIRELSPGTLLHLRVLRDGVQQQLQWAVGGSKQNVFRLQDVPGITQQQRLRRSAWLFGDATGKQ